MSIGDQPAFPVPIDNNGEALKTPIAWGMTYRQWLVGQIAGHVTAEAIRDGWPAKDFGPDIAMNAFLAADAIIKRMKDEGK